MAYRDLQEFISVLESKGLLKRVTAPVSPILEIAEITDRTTKAGGPALLFTRVEGSAVPLLINTFGTWERMALALGVRDVEEIAKGIEAMVRTEIPVGILDKIKSLAMLYRLTKFPPSRASSGICQEVVEPDPDLSRLPILQCWPKDGGRFITFPLVVTKDAETGKRNVGTYRLQVFDGKTTAMHWHLHHDAPRHFRGWRAKGLRMPVAACLGGDPAVMYAATAPLPPDFDELLFAGYLRGENVEVVPCKTVDLEVPANAEIVIEGYVDPEERRVEGPFGDHTGFYSLEMEYPVFHVTAITRRKSPVYPTIVVGKPIQEDYFLGKATERIFLPLIRLHFPEIVDLNFPPFGIFHNFCVVSIDKRYPLHARRVMHGLWGFGQMSVTKTLLVVDKEVDVQDLDQVLWVMGNNIDPERDIEFVHGPVDILDHASRLPHVGSKMGIDATRKWPEEGFARPWPEAITMAKEIVHKVTERWKEYGL